LLQMSVLRDLPELDLSSIPNAPPLQSVRSELLPTIAASAVVTQSRSLARKNAKPRRNAAAAQVEAEIVAASERASDQTQSNTQAVASADKRSTCNECKKTFPAPWNLRRHLKASGCARKIAAAAITAASSQHQTALVVVNESSASAVPSLLPQPPSPQPSASQSTSLATQPELGTATDTVIDTKR
jgi:hypothetical protein